MKIHEYQAKEILARYGVAVPRGEVANTLEEASTVARKLFAEGAGGVVVKAQIHAGGRGKGGGVKVARTREDAELQAKNILGMTLVTHQTGPLGQKVQRLLIEETAAIDRELYLGIVLDRVTGKLVFMASQAGGMEIEDVAAKTPGAIFKETIDPAIGFGAWQARKLAFALGLKPKQINAAVAFLQSLYKAFIETDASLVEINPFITTKDDKLFALDAKITFDDNALFRHPEIKALRDTAEEDPLEVEASKYALNYIKLDGTIACMVNGAGLAMATMDIIQYAGGSPANFLDVGGGATQEQIEHAFEILLSDSHVKAIFINIFGGILRVDRLATGVVAAARNLNVKVPIVLRLEGTNVEEGRKILKESGFNFMVGETMKEAAELVVKAALDEVLNNCPECRRLLLEDWKDSIDVFGQEFFFEQVELIAKHWPNDICPHGNKAYKFEVKINDDIDEETRKTLENNFLVAQQRLRSIGIGSGYHSPGMDASKYIGYPVREHGPYGSHPVEDAYDDESSPDGPGTY
jgi:succinyl-CoA synthetase beta subunit